MTWEYSALRRDFEYTKARIQTKRERLVSVSLRIEQLLAEQRELELCIGKSGEHLQELSDRMGGRNTSPISAPKNAVVVDHMELGT
ncbi:MAG: hypothetical protein WC350_06015 [Candidatus Micrarchaeia archaeon]|jgi:predicted  nucleic acid-binding Zn-ribbon protein